MATQKDIRDELSAALQGNFHFDGATDCAWKLSSTPSLSIEGIGQITLPLCEHHAKAIIQAGDKPVLARGRGKKTPVKKNVDSVVEVKPSRVSFADDNKWSMEFEKYTIPVIWSHLVGRMYSTPPKFLGRFSVKKYGSELPGGAVATLVVLLPSSYQGGQFHLTYDGQTKVVDRLATSEHHSSFVAWYNEVGHEVQPVGSGYCLALSYNLIHSGSMNTVPRLPAMNNDAERFRAVLRKWKNSLAEPQTNKVSAYLLKNRYHQTSFYGARSLEGEDCHLVTHIEAPSRELGFTVLIGLLGYDPTNSDTLEDDEDDEGYMYPPNKRSRYSSYDGSDDSDSSDNSGEDDTLDAESTSEEVMKNFRVEHPFNLNGDKVIGENSLPLQEENLIPKNPSLEGHVGGYFHHPPELDPAKRQAVVVLIPNSEVNKMFFKIKGIPYALEKLQESTSDIPSAEDKEVMEMAIQGLKSWDSEMAKSLLEYLLRWKALNAWKRIVLQERNTVSTFGLDMLASALQKFALHDIQTCFEDLLQRTQCLKDRLDFIDAVEAQSNGQDENIRSWCDRWALHFLRALRKPETKDIPTLIKAAKKRGTSFLVKEILPQLAQNKNHISSFVTAFAQSLIENQDSIPTSSPSYTAPVAWATFFHECLNIAANQCPHIQTPSKSWCSIYLNPEYDTGYSTDYQVGEYIKVFELCIITGQLGPLSTLSQRVLTVPGETDAKVSTIYARFVFKLGKLCRKTEFDILTPPLHHLLQWLVSLCLHNIGPSLRQDYSKIRKLGCGSCDECKELDTFITGTKWAEHSFKSNKKIRTHLEERLRPASDLVSFKTITEGSPHTLQITKCSDIVSAQQWITRLRNAKTFVANIGDDVTIARLMGDRYPDAQLALKGALHFPEPPVVAATDPMTVYQPHSGPSSSAPADVTQQRTAGIKRKRTAPSMPMDVIDLTSD